MGLAGIEFAEGQARINRELDAFKEVVLAVASTGQLRGIKFKGRYWGVGDLFVITRDEEGDIFTADVRYSPQSRLAGKKVEITGYGTFFLPEDKWKNANDAIDHTQSGRDYSRILCDGPIADELLTENFALGVGNNSFVLHRPYGLVRIYSSVPPTVRPKAVSYYGDWRRVANQA